MFVVQNLRFKTNKQPFVFQLFSLVTTTFDRGEVKKLWFGTN